MKNTVEEVVEKIEGLKKKIKNSSESER
jgi:uncharacterized protein YlzI (FlbEa/FlbD family)